MLNKLLVLTSLMALTLTAGFYDDFALYSDLFIFPHQVAVADVIYTGTVVTNRNGGVAEFTVDEMLWGNLPSSNISIRCVNNLHKLSFESDNRYLVFAFTNNWWSERNIKRESYGDISVLYLSDFLSVTSKPPDCATFPDCRIMEPDRSVFNLNKFEVGGTNYWPGTRTFITNFLEITRIQNSETNAFKKIDSILSGAPGTEVLPQWLLRQLLHYNWVRYNNTEHVPKYVPNVIHE